MRRAGPIAAIAAIAAIAITLALGGCGGDTRRGESESTGPTHAQPLTALPQGGRQAAVPVAAVTDPRRRAYIRRTDSICGRYDKERNSERENVRDATDLNGAESAYERGTVLGRTELRQLEAVPPPPGEGALLRANVFDPVRRQLALRAEVRKALSNVELPRLRALRAQLDDISRALSAFARGYGWRACGEA